MTGTTSPITTAYLALPADIRARAEELEEEFWSQTVPQGSEVTVAGFIARAIQAERERAWNAGYLAGFMASGEGWNGEYPYDEEIYQRSAHWLSQRDTARLLYAPPETEREAME